MKPIHIALLFVALTIAHSKISIPLKSKSSSASVYQGNFTSFLDTAFYIDIALGTPPQNFTVVVDTTSADLWVPGKNCTDNDLPFCSNHSKYNSAASSTYVDVSNNDLIDGEGFPDGGGDVAGKLAEDTLYIFGLEMDSVQFYEMEHTEILNNTYLKFDGILGLGYPSQGDYSIFQHMVNKGLVKNNSFSLYYSNNEDSDLAGELILGGIDPTVNATPFNYLKFINNDTYTLRLDKLEIGGKTYARDIFTVTFTSASGFIEVTPILAELIYRDHKPVVNCSEVPSLPSLVITTKGQTIEIPAKNYYRQNGDSCEILVVGGQIFPTEILIGVPFFTTYYAQFLMDDHMIGYAPIQTGSQFELEM